LHSRSSRHGAADISPSDADSSWQEAIDNKLYGADTPDYSYVPEQPVTPQTAGRRHRSGPDRS
ncbi:hypothetical protein EN935_11235, partial [Mesorhizobium sp. M7D.F.Ca.US.004.03.1.1]